MTYQLDTDICVFWLRGHTWVRDQLIAVGLDNVVVSVVTLAELRYGAEYPQQPAANHQAIGDFVSATPVLGIDATTASVFGKVKAQLRRQGRLIADLDLLIGATALAHDLTLVTNNAEHFGRIDGLRLEHWARSAD